MRGSPTIEFFLVKRGEYTILIRSPWIKWEFLVVVGIQKVLTKVFEQLLSTGCEVIVKSMIY